MKNKKLFAILTLVCFMMTLMPVAAFAANTTYAEVDSDDAIVRLSTSGAANVTVNLTSPSATQYYVYAVKADGTLYTGLKGGSEPAVADEDGAATPNGIRQFASAKSLVVTFADAGEYTVFVTPVEGAIVNVVKNANYARTNAQILALLKQETVTMLDNSVSVKPANNKYKLTLEENAAIKANSGYDVYEVVATLTNADTQKPVVGATLKISTNSPAVDIDETEVKTNAAGQAKFKISASVAGEFKVYVEYGTKADATLTVNAGTLAPAKITTVSEPKNPIALDEAIRNSDVTFAIADANGNTVKAGMVKKDVVVDEETGEKVYVGNYKVSVTEKPAGSTIDADSIELKYNANNAVWFLDGASFDEEGDYIVKVTLNNGNYATAKVTVKEFQTPVELKMTYKQNAVELNGKALLDKLYYVDENGVKKSLVTSVDSKTVNEDGDTIYINGVKTAKLAANGYAVNHFYANAVEGKMTTDNKTIAEAGINAGTVVVKSDEKYVGSKITVVAVDTKYNLTATVELTVANEAAEVKYANTKADVAVNNTLTANIVDQDGNKVALNESIKNANISYVVLEKPENAKVALSTVSEQLAAKGQFKVSFTASEIGNYKVQTVVTYEQADGVVKYYSGIETITVGNTGFNDIVVMSINSNEIVVNAEKVAIDAAPIVKNDRTFVPFRALAEAFGAEVAYDEATQAVTAELNGVKVVMTIGSATYTINGVEKTMDVAPFINGSRTMIPVRFAAEAFGITVTPTYDENGATADVLFAK